jgi:hypothetical protein
VTGERARIIAGVLARAARSGRRVFGFTSARPSCAMLDAKLKSVTAVPWEWDRICVEGDEEWTPMPRGEVPVAKKVG